MESGIGVSAIGRDDNVAIVSILNPPHRPGVAYLVFSTLADAGIDVDIILQTETTQRSAGIVFTIRQDDAGEALKLLSEAFKGENTPYGEANEMTTVVINEDAVKISVSGAGMQGKPGVAAKVFKCLWNEGIEIINISTSEIKISMLINEYDAEKATKALNETFIDGIN